MTNICKWLKSITKEDFRAFFSIQCGRCSDCPAVDFCHAGDDDKCCEEEFYDWAVKECCQVRKSKFIDINDQFPTPGQSIVFEAENGQRFFGNVSDERDEIVVDVDDPGCEKEFGPMIRFTADEIKAWLPVEFEEGGLK